MSRQILGVYGANLPTKKTLTVEAADFGIGCVYGVFERSYANAYAVNNMAEFQEIFGINFSSSYYGYDTVNLFFQNTSGTTAKTYVKSFIGNTGSAVDAVVATVSINDLLPTVILNLFAAYKNDKEYGTHGNRIGYTITNGARFTTALNGGHAASLTVVTVDSVSGIRVGDIVKVVCTGAPSTQYFEVATIDETNKTFTFTGGGIFTGTGADNDVVTVMGIRVRVYEKGLTGIIKEVETEIGQTYCSMQSSVSEFYIQNVFANHKYMRIDVAASAATLEKRFPADVSSVAYLASGAAGTAPTTVSHWQYEFLTTLRFDNLTFRFLCCPETTLATVNNMMETYCYGRWDNPKVLFNLPSNQTKAQLITIGNSYQVSRDTLGIGVAHWLYISDPFVNSPTAPYRAVPNVGAVMGAWIKTINTYGIHVVPAVKEISISGITGIYGTQFTAAVDRTDLAEAGINCMETLSGYGNVIRNFRTFSITTEFKYANGILMRSFFQVSAVNSLQGEENKPNSLSAIAQNKNSIEMFFRRMWDRGSTGNVSKGETFGMGVNTDGSPTTFSDHIVLQADAVNNPQSNINLGIRKIDGWYSYPAPAETIIIGIGILLR
jgi:hypothetical protein